MTRERNGRGGLTVVAALQDDTTAGRRRFRPLAPRCFFFFFFLFVFQHIFNIDMSMTGAALKIKN